MLGGSPWIVSKRQKTGVPFQIKLMDIPMQIIIRAIHKSGALNLVTTQRCDLAIPKSWAIFYNLELVVALAFRLNTYEASMIRQKVLESLSQPQKAEINLFLILNSVKNKYYHDIKQNNQH